MQEEEKKKGFSYNFSYKKQQKKLKYKEMVSRQFVLMCMRVYFFIAGFLFKSTF